MTLARQIPWHKASKLDLRSIFTGGVDGAVFGAHDPNVLLTRRNLLVNTAFAGAVAGTPGTAPTSWSFGFSGGTTGIADGVLTQSVAGAARQFINNTGGTVLRPGATYTFSVEITATSGTTELAVLINVASGSLVSAGDGITFFYSSRGVGRHSVTFVAGAAGATIQVRIGPGSGGVTSGASSLSFKEPQLELGTTATAYQPVTDWTTEYLAVNRYELVQQWQESTGVTPVMVAETACGLRMDNSRSLVRGAELWNTAGVSFVGASSQVSSGVYRIQTPDTTYSGAFVNGSLVVGRIYECFLTIDSITTLGGGVSFEGVSAPAFTTLGPKRIILPAISTGAGVKRWSTACDIQVSNVSFREIPGNHTLQATAAARPVVSQRVNIGVLTRNLAVQASGTPTSPAAVWAYNPTHGNAVTNNTAVGPDGVATASTLTFVAAGTYAIFALYSGLTVGVQYTFSIKVKLGTATNFCITANNNVAWDTMTGEREFTTADGLSTTGWKTVSITTTAVATSIAICLGRHSETGLAQQTVGTAFVCDHDLRLASDALFNIPAYQYVNTATDYATDGFPAYEYFTTDDFRVSATGGGATTGFYWRGVVTVLGGAGAIRILHDDRSGNNGVIVALSAANDFGIYLGNGSAFISAVTGANSVVVGTTYVLTCWYVGGVGYAQINNQTPVASAAVTLVAGTASFTVGRTNGSSSSYFNGRAYNSVYVKDFYPGDNFRERDKRDAARRAGCLHLVN